MDFILENENMGMSEKNKELFISMSQDIGNKQSEDKDTFKVYSSFIKEKEGILKIISQICDFALNPTTTKNDTITTPEKLIEYKNRIIMILSSYQEQPGLIDPILPTIIPQMMNSSLQLINVLLKAENKQNFEFLTCIYQIIYIICKMRGYSIVAKFFSSEVSIFENVINFLISLPYESATSWYVNYVLVLWTSLLAMVPFDIDTIDSEGNLISKLLEYFKFELCRSTNLRIITSYSIGKFLTRPDLIKKGLLDAYINSCTEIMFDTKTNSDIFKMIGIELSLCEIFKNGIQGDLAKHIPAIVNQIPGFKYPDFIQSSGIFRKNMTKLVQRAGIILLKPRSQNWRYHLDLKNALSKQSDAGNTNTNIAEDEDELNYDIDFNLLENIIDFLMKKLSDKEYIVRWSSAKGIGRICERLPKGMVFEIMHNIFELFKDEENDFAWHGACLAIAELCKRGMILPESLSELVPLLNKALTYEINKGAYCTGSSVRDSACYIVWALARGFESNIMKPYVNQLAASLILTILFDKDINCRRAASAAFQENVGRQGNFPHGIEILTEADYFTLGNKNSCFLNISLFIAQYQEYYKIIVDYLSFNRLFHIEKQIRELSAESLALLVPFNPGYFISDIIPKLIEYSQNMSLQVRHGSVIGLGHILLGLNGKWDFYRKSRINRKQMMSTLSNKEKKILADSDYRKEFDKYYDSIKNNNNLALALNNAALVSKLIDLVSSIDTEELYRGKGNELMRYAVNEYIRLISEVRLPITAKQFIYFHEILTDNIRQIKHQIQDDACNSLKTLNKVYGEEFYANAEVKEKIEKMFLNVITYSVIHDSVSITKGYTSACICFNPKYLETHYDDLIQALTISSKMKKSNNDSLTRMAAIDGIGYLTLNFYKEKQSKVEANISTIFDSFNDYELDQKVGDVGSNVRMACVRNIVDILLLLHKQKNFALFSKYVVKGLQMVMKQMAERMMTLRRVAGNALQKFFYELKAENQEDLEKVIPDFKKLSEIFLKDVEFDDYDNIDNPNWIESDYAYPKMMPILYMETYASSLIEGLIRSIGCITEDTQKGALDELKKVLESDIENRNLLINKIFDVCIDMLTKHKRQDKYTESVLSSLVCLLQIPIFINNDFIDKIDKLQKLIIQEIYCTGNIHKVLDTVDIYYNMLFFEKEEKFHILNRITKSMLFLLCHKYPVVRKKAAEKFFTFISGLDDGTLLNISDDELFQVTEILGDTDWTSKVSEVRENRNKMAEILKINLEQ